MASVDSGRFIAKTVDFSIPKAHNLLGCMFTPMKFKELWKKLIQ